MYELEDSYWWFVGKRRIARNLLDGLRLPGQGPILDVGCGTGAMMQFLARYGQVHGLDISETALHFCRKRKLSNICQASILHLPFADRTFSLITAFDVLYHKQVEDDIAALRELNRVSQSGGYLLVTDSAFKFLWSEHDVATHARQRYTLGELKEKLERAGFRLEKGSYANALLFPVVFIMRKFPIKAVEGYSDLRPINPYLNRVLTAIYGFEASLMRRISFPFGTSVVCLARKV
ncbi:MAG: class I SAM-dependent methyltransferase [Anaerolineae bacterium]